MVRVNFMNSLRMQGASSFLLLVPFLVSPLTFAETEARCESYISSSLLQHKENLGNACHFSGSRWNANVQGQKKWCLGVSEKSLSTETAERSRWLAVCKSRNQQQGKPYYPAKKNCLPKSFNQFKNTDASSLRQCLSVNKSPVTGSKNGADYLSYLHGFGEEYYLFNFLGKGSNLRLKTHYIGNKQAYCSKQSSINGSFSLVKEKRGITIIQRCSSKSQLEDGTRPDIDYSSSETVAFELLAGVWRPTFDYHHTSFYSSMNSHSEDEDNVYDWVTNFYFNSSNTSRMHDGWSSSSVETGKLLTKSTSLSIASFYPETKKILRSKPSKSASCHHSERTDDVKMSCDHVVDMRERLNIEGGRLSEIRNY